MIRTVHRSAQATIFPSSHCYMLRAMRTNTIEVKMEEDLLRRRGSFVRVLPAVVVHVAAVMVARDAAHGGLGSGEEDSGFPFAGSSREIVQVGARTSKASRNTIIINNIIILILHMRFKNTL